MSLHDDRWFYAASGVRRFKLYRGKLNGNPHGVYRKSVQVKWGRGKDWLPFERRLATTEEIDMWEALQKSRSFGKGGQNAEGKSKEG